MALAFSLPQPAHHSRHLPHAPPHPQSPNNVWKGSGRRRFVGTNFQATMHNFALEWTSDPATGRPARMRWLVDGEVYYTQV